MRDAGYTATEALAALAIVGLAVGGLTSGMQVIGRAQSAAVSSFAHAAAIDAAGRNLDRLLSQGGAFRSDAADGFRGDAAAFSFPCGAMRCQAAIAGASMVVTGGDGVRRAVVLPGGARLRFVYGGALGDADAWPPDPPPPPAPQWQTLQFVALADARTGHATPVSVSRVWTQQAANCDFDTISQDCRRTGP